VISGNELLIVLVGVALDVAAVASLASASDPKINALLGVEIVMF